MLYFWHISKVQIEVITFVMEAIYRLALDLKPTVKENVPNCDVGLQ